MRIHFAKYQGTGNDFILFDNRNATLRRDLTTWYAQICDRHFGIGADGVILLEKDPELDFSMVYFNADGRESSMCGNGGRCLADFAMQLGLVGKQCVFRAVDGVHRAEMEDGGIRLQMRDVDGIRKADDHYELDTGSPHYVTFVPDVENIPVKEHGAAIRYSHAFIDKGINVNFVHMRNAELVVRSYERGVEDETLSCGTGITASAICNAIETREPVGIHSVQVRAKGGLLRVSYTKISDTLFRDIWLAGPAVCVYRGEISMPGTG